MQIKTALTESHMEIGQRREVEMMSISSALRTFRTVLEGKTTVHGRKSLNMIIVGRLEVNQGSTEDQRFLDAFTHVGWVIGDHGEYPSDDTFWNPHHSICQHNGSKIDGLGGITEHDKK
jgi:hypothetical protein